MGENRPSAMRGGSMEDVIFSGSASRLPAVFAEVQAVIDNGDRAAPTNFNDDDELVITRRIERGVGSQFLANGREVRWRDLQLLFADASTGARSSALVNQGQTNDIINSKPTARKGILEEAAGVSGLHRRRREAELRLSNTGQNLQRAKDVVERLQGQIAALSRQAKHALRYKKLGTQLREAEAKLLYTIWHNAKAIAIDADQAKQLCIEKSEQLQAESAKAVARRAQLEQGLQPLREKSVVSDSALQRMRAEVELTESKEAAAKQALTTLKLQMDEASKGIQREQELSDDASAHISKLQDLFETKCAEDKECKEQYDQLAHKLEVAVTDVKTLEQDVETVNRRRVEIRSARDSAEVAKRTAEKKVQQCFEREQSASIAVDEARWRLVEAEADVKSAHIELVIAETNAQNAEKELAESESKRAVALVNFTDMCNTLAEAESRLRTLRSEEGELQKLVRSHETDGNRLLNQVRVKEGYEAALGAALGNDLFAMADVAADSTGWQDIDPFLIVPSLPESVTPLSRFVEVPTLLERRISQVGVVEQELIHELKDQLLPGQRVVTVAGDLIRWDGFFVSGQETPQQSALRLKQINRLEQLTTEIEFATSEAASRQKNHDRLAEEFKCSDAADRHARAKRRQTEKELTDANRLLSTAETDANIAEKNLTAAQEAQRRAESETKATKDLLAKAEQSIAMIADSKDTESVANELRERANKARDAMFELRSQKLSLEREREERLLNLKEIPTEIKSWQERKNRAKQRILDLTDQLDQHCKDLIQIQELPSQIACQRSNLLIDIEAADERHKVDNLRLKEAEIAARSAAEEAAQAEQDAAKSFEAKGRADADSINAVEKLLAATEKIRETLSCCPQSLAAGLELTKGQLPEVELQEIEVNRLRRSRDSLGAVNLMAEKDIESLQSEKDLLESEVTDLEEAVGRLRRTITSLNKNGRNRLVTAFETVNTNFVQLFAELFGGGKARLELVEGDDPLDIGLEILCRPPGKRFSTISLLSGGEQTLTAMALIFAFFLASPAPICVLDEVDAPLDDSNVLKFCKLMRNIVQRTETRFLVITHNPITMTRMDRLFGVTMQEKGVSKLVSVDLGEAEKLAA